jgi:purine catabolism regulator
MGDVANDPAGPPEKVPAPGETSARPPATAPTSSGLSLADVLRTPSLRDARVLAGRSGLDRVVQRLDVVELPDGLTHAAQHELLLTSRALLPPSGDALTDLVTRLDARGVAGLAVRPAHDLDRLPDEAVRRADELGFPLVLLPATARFDDVLDQVLTDVLHRQAAVLARSEEVDRALVQIVLDGGGLQEVTDELVAVLGGVVAVTTPDGRVLAVSGRPDAVAAVLSGPHVDASGRFRVERTRAGVVPDPLTGDGRGSTASVPVVAGGVHHGRLLAFSCGRLDGSDVHALERAATVAALVVTKALAVLAVESKYQGDFLRDLLSGRAGSAEQAVPHSASLGWDVDRPLVVVVAELDPTDSAPQGAPAAVRPAQERFAAAWTSVVRARDPRAAVVGFAHEVVALVGLPAHGDVDRAVRELVGAVSGDGGGGRRSFSCGVSRVAASPEQLPAAYEQARKAVHVGRQLHGAGAVAHFDGLGVFRLLSLIPTAGSCAGSWTRRSATWPTPRTRRPRTCGARSRCCSRPTSTSPRRPAPCTSTTTRCATGSASSSARSGPFTRDPTLRLNLLLALQVLRMRGLGTTGT